MSEFIKEYKILDEKLILGEGAFSTVLKILNLKENKIYAMKKVE